MTINEDQIRKQWVSVFLFIQKENKSVFNFSLIPVHVTKFGDYDFYEQHDQISVNFI